MNFMFESDIPQFRHKSFSEKRQLRRIAQKANRRLMAARLLIIIGGIMLWRLLGVLDQFLNGPVGTLASLLWLAIAVLVMQIFSFVIINPMMMRTLDRLESADGSSVSRDTLLNRTSLARERIHRPTRGSFIKAVFVGGLVFLLGGALIVGLLEFIWASVFENVAALEQQKTNWLSTYSFAMDFATLVVLACAGFLCARIARRRDYIAPALVSLMPVALIVVVVLFVSPDIWNRDHMPGWAQLLSAALQASAVLFGAWLHLRRVDQLSET